MAKMSKKQREQRDRGLMILWCLSQRNAAIDAYKKAVRKYCLTCENWNEVCKASAECHRNGVTDEVCHISSPFFAFVTSGAGDCHSP